MTLRRVLHLVGLVMASFVLLGCGEKSSGEECCRCICSAVNPFCEWDFQIYDGPGKSTLDCKQVCRNECQLRNCPVTAYGACNDDIDQDSGPDTDTDTETSTGPMDAGKDGGYPGNGDSGVDSGVDSGI